MSAFGFGGINAHVLIEEWDEAPAQEPAGISLTSPAVPVAVVGMGAHFGPWKTLRAFQERVLGNGNAEEPCRRGRWWGVEDASWYRGAAAGNDVPPGYYLDELSVPLDRYRIPPRELEEMLPQQLLMLEVADDAARDARMGKDDNQSTGVFIGLGLDMNTTNFTMRWSLLNKAREWAQCWGLRLSPQELAEWVDELREAAGPALSANRTMGALGSVAASRIAREFRCGGPSFTVANQENSGMRALELGVRALQQREVDCALVGAVDMASDIRSLASWEAVSPFDDGNGIVPGEGGAALVLKRLDDAVRDGDRVYAVVKGIGTSGGAVGAARSGEAYGLALERAYAEAGVDADSVGYVETDGVERGALEAFFGARDTELPCALGNAKADIGHTGAAAGLAGFAKACLCLYQEIIPPSRGTRSGQNAGAAFVEPNTPRHWLQDRADGPRRAGVMSSSLDGTCAHVVLEACDQAAHADAAERLQPLGARSEALFTVEANNVQALAVGLGRLRSHVEASADAPIEAVARRWWAENREEPQRRLAAALIARSHAELLQQIAFVEQWLADSRDKRLDGNGMRVLPPYARDRVFYSPEPLGKDGKIAFLFPGSGNHFADMGRELGVYWPEVFRRQNAQNNYLRGQYQPEVFWNPASFDENGENHRAMIFGQVALGTAFADLIQEFGIRPDAAIGYSLGESAALFALHAWTDRDEMLRRMNNSTLFTSDLVGSYDAVRKAWKLPPSKGVDWVLGVIDRPSRAVLAALKDHKKVYRLIANTLHESVIGGDRHAVERLVKKLECEFMPLKGVSSVHCEVAREVEKPYRDLHLFDVTPPKGVTFYSGASGRAYDVTRESAADAILAQALHGIDFPKVVNGAYADGVRVFLEMGPGGSCSRMVGEILGEKPHAARSLCVQGQGAVSTVLRALGCLIAERVPVELTALYGQDTRVVGHRRPDDDRPRLTVLLGGAAFDPPVPQGRPTVTPTQTEPVAAFEVCVPAGVAAEWNEAETQGEAAPMFTPLVHQADAALRAQSEAHAAFLRFSENTRNAVAENLALQISVIEAMTAAGVAMPEIAVGPPVPAVAAVPTKPPVAFDRDRCMEFAVGKISAVLGPDFAEVDQHPTRVRLPDEPLMLVDRIVSVDAEPRSMSSGRVVTEHDVLEGGWYLDSGRIPTCIAVEAGQADLFLSGYLGIDFETKGVAMYRLLDAVVTFHGPLPTPGQVIRYDITIERFFKQGNTYLFRFQFDGTVDGKPLLTMRDGCAGFFTNEELDAGRGLVQPPRPL